MGTLSGSGGVSTGLYIMYFSGKRERQEVSIAFLLGACVL